MGEARLPPWYVNVTRWLLYEVELPPSVRVTGMRILGLGWNHDYEYTDPVPLPQLRAWCGLSRARIYGHLRQLRLAGVLRYTALAEVFVFDLRLARAHGGPARAGPSLNNETRNALSVVVDSSLSITKDSLILQEEKQQQQIVSESWGECEGGAGRVSKMRLASPENRIDDEEWEMRIDALEGMGVLEPTRSELAELGHATVGYLEGWEDWFLTQEKVGSGFVVCRVRDGDEAPRLSREQKLLVDVRRRCDQLGLAHGGRKR